VALRACGHIFCRGCLLPALAGDRRCPTCRAAAGGAAADAVATLVTPAHTVASLIDELPVRCAHGVTLQPGGGADDWVVEPGGCDAIVARGQLAAHTASCPFEPVGCAQAQHGCAWRGARRGLAEHAGSCWYEQGRELVQRVAELAKANAAAAEKAEAEIAQMRAEAAAQLAALRAEVETLQAEKVEQGRRGSEAQLQRIREAEVALESAAGLKQFRATRKAAAPAAAQAARVVVRPPTRAQPIPRKGHAV
jgi:hypothetical protein